MSDSGQPDSEPEVPDPEMIEEAILSALDSLGIKAENMGEVFVQQVTGPQALHLMHQIMGAQMTGPETSWMPRFLSDIVIQNSTISLAARPELSLEDLARNEDDLTKLVNSMPELSLEDHDAYLVWKQEVQQLIVIVDRAVERWRDDASD